MDVELAGRHQHRCGGAGVVVLTGIYVRIRLDLQAGCSLYLLNFLFFYPTLSGVC